MVAPLEETQRCPVSYGARRGAIGGPFCRAQKLLRNTDLCASNGGKAARLTAKERILLHLWEYAEYSDSIDVPIEMTQEGIASGTWIEDRHVPQYVRPLIKEGLVRERMAHVRGSRQRRKVYDLTDFGKASTVRLREHVKTEKIRVRQRNGLREVTLAEALRMSPHDSLLRAMHRLTADGILDLQRGPLEIDQNADASFQDAIGLEANDEWQGAAKLYEHALVSDSERDPIRRALLQERIGRALFHAALQEETASGFQDRLRMCSEAYDRARNLFRGIDRPEAAPYALRCAAWEPFLALWRSSDSLEKSKAAAETWERAKSAIQGFEDLEFPGELAATYAELVLSVDFSNAFERDPEIRKTRITEAIAFGERAAKGLTAQDNRDQLARIYAKLSWYYAYFLRRTSNPEEGRRYKLRFEDYQRKAHELSERASIAELPWFEYTFDKDLGTEQSIARFQRAVDIGRTSRNQFLLGFALSWSGYQIGWKTMTLDDPDERAALVDKGLELVDEARTRLAPLSVACPHFGLLWGEWPRPYASFLREFREPDLEKRRSLMEEVLDTSAEYVARAKRSGYDYAERHSLWLVGFASMALAKSEMDPVKKRALLERAVSDLAEGVRLSEARDPLYEWDRGMAQSELADVYSEYAKLVEDRAGKVRALEEAVAMKESAAKLCSPPDPPPAILTSMGHIRDSLGHLLMRLSEVNGSSDALTKAAASYRDATDLFRKSGMTSWTAECHWKAAAVLDKLGNHAQAADEFVTASELYEAAARQIPRLWEFYHELAVYLHAWSDIERAHEHHAREEYGAAKESYERASSLHRLSKKWWFMASNYAAWAHLEAAEDLSRADRSSESIAQFERGRDGFGDSQSDLESALPTLSADDETAMVQTLVKAVGRRKRYCSARILLEKGKLEEREGRFLSSAESYGRSARELERLGEESETEQDGRDLRFIARLARAWESMAKADAESSSELYSQAARLFEDAKEASRDERTKSLALGHSRFCNALEAGVKFADKRDRAFYEEAVKHLESAAHYYSKAGFPSAAEYAEASKLLFDAYAQMDEVSRKGDAAVKAKEYLIAEHILGASAAAYARAGYPGKREQVERLADHVRREREVAQSLGELLRAPSIMSSTSALVTPSATYETAVGHRRFEHGEIHSRVVADRTHIEVNGEVDLEIEIVNVGRSAVEVVKIEAFPSDGFEVIRLPDGSSLVGESINLRGKSLQPFKTQELKIGLRANRDGRYAVKLRILFLDEEGVYRANEPEALEIEVRSTGSGSAKDTIRT